MRRLIESLTDSLDTVSLVRRAAEQMCLYTPAASGASIVLRDPGAPTTSSSSPPTAQRRACSDTSLRARIVLGRGHAVARTVDRRRRLHRPRVPRTSRALAAGLDVRSWIVIPLRHNDLVVGAMSVVASTPSAFDDAAAAAIISLSSFVAALMSSQSSSPTSLRRCLSERKRRCPSLGHRDLRRESALSRLDRGRSHTPGTRPALRPRCLAAGVSAHRRSVYWSYRRLRGPEPFPHASERNVEEWFGVAQRAGRGVELEIHAVDEILTASAQLPADLPIAVNLSPCAAADPRAHALLLSAGRPVCVELTEHDRFPDDLFDALTPLRRYGLDIAVDDVGAGYATLLQILRLKPDVIKIDAEFTAGVQTDPARRVLTAAIVELSAEVGAVTVAEAIETEDQLRALRDLGVSRGQGTTWVGRGPRLGRSRSRQRRGHDSPGRYCNGYRGCDALITPLGRRIRETEPSAAIRFGLA